MKSDPGLFLENVICDTVQKLYLIFLIKTLHNHLCTSRNEVIFFEADGNMCFF